MDNFERVLILLFEEDIVTGQWEDKILNFLNLDLLPKDWGIYTRINQGIPKIVCCIE